MGLVVVQQLQFRFVSSRRNGKREDVADEVTSSKQWECDCVEGESGT